MRSSISGSMGRTLNLFRIAFLLFSFVAAIALLAPDVSRALPAWSRKYDVACSMCHTPLFPRLNLYGEQFLANGYQEVDTQDGDKEGKKNLDPLLNLDTMVGHWFSARLNVTPFQIETNALTVEGERDSKTTVGNTNWLQFFVAGSITKNISIYIENEFTPGGFHQAWYYLGFQNLADSPWLNFQVGRLSAVVFAPYPDRLPQLPAIGGGVMRVRSSDGLGESSLDIRSPRYGVQYYGWDGPVALYAGVSPGPNAVNPANNMDFWVGGRLFAMNGGSFDGSSVAIHFEKGTDTKNAATENIENDFQRIMPGGNPRYRDRFEVQAAYVIAEEDNRTLTETPRALDYKGVRVVGSWYPSTEWALSVHYDNFSPDDEEDEDLLSERHMLFAPVVTWLWWENFRVSFYPGFDLRDVDSELKNHTFSMNIRTAF